ncbi:major facilitator superfamily domain-containing protein [Ampelomyces quisqualis]|uniref:Major facilitator superfamily domain-containing protein n=1 Tax=Ampelomyces quisqualis TaxID=50730 RepID=A0A6A5QI96_AMPQU|nr:major facilitator superfamily domain-containing protein [Ampelomyces quisqualis]
MVFLIRSTRRKYAESKARKAPSTSEEPHLVPESAPGESQYDMTDKTQGGIIRNQQDASGGHFNALAVEEAARQKDETRKRNIRQWKLMLGLALPNFLASVNTFTTCFPAFGQLANIYGRHFALQFEMVWITSWGMLLLGRALQGLGAAGIMSLSRIILSDGATLAENARSNSLLSLIAGFSYAIGPFIGGYLADSGWRYIFVLPIGVAVLAMLFIFLVMRKELVQGRATATARELPRLGYITGLRIMDWPGMIIFILGMGLIILAIQWGGTSHAWNSPAIIAPLVVGGILCIAFFIYEYLLGPGRFVARLFPNQIPMIPSTLFRKKDTSLLMIINFSAGISLVSAFYFISYYWQLAESYSPSRAGVQLLYYTPVLGVGVYIAMFLCNRWPRQTFSPLLWGLIIEGLGLALLTYSVSIRHQTMVKAFLAVAGAGTGLPFMPVFLHAAGIWSTEIPSMQSLLSFMSPLGETIGISMMGAVFSNELGTRIGSIARVLPRLGLSSSAPPSLDLINGLPTKVKTGVQNAAAKAVMWALISVLPFVALSIIASALLGNVWIGKPTVKSKDYKPGRQEEKGKVMYGVYVAALLTGGIAAQKYDLDVNLGHESEDKRAKVIDVEADGGGVAQPELVHAGR